MATRSQAMRSSAPTEPSDLPPAAELKQCDQLSFTATGKVAGARDVNRVHIDAKFCVHADHERVEGTAFPRRIGDGMILCSDCPDGYSAGRIQTAVSWNGAPPIGADGCDEVSRLMPTPSGKAWFGQTLSTTTVFGVSPSK